jgi:transposase
VPAVPAFLIEPLWYQFQSLVPEVVDTHPKGGHRPRIPDRVVFDKLIQVLVLGAAYEKIADSTCSATTIRRRRDEWIDAGAFAELEQLCLLAYDKMIGLDLENLVVDGCIVKAPCGGQAAGRSPVDRGKQGTKRSLMVDGNGIPLGVVVAGANRHDSPLLRPTLELLRRFDDLPEKITVHLDAGYDSHLTRDLLAELGCDHQIATKGIPAPIQASTRWSSNARTPGTTAASGSSPSAPKCEHESSTRSSPSPTPSSPSDNSSAKDGPATAGTDAPPADHDQLARTLTLIAENSIRVSTS